MAAGIVHTRHPLGCLEYRQRLHKRMRFRRQWLLEWDRERDRNSHQRRL